MSGNKPRPYEALPLDIAILQVLPEEGTQVAFTQLAKQAKSIVRDLNEQLPAEAPKVTSSSVNGRLRRLREEGLVVNLVVQPVANGLGWQRTSKAMRLVQEREAEGGTTMPPSFNDRDRATEEIH